MESAQRRFGWNEILVFGFAASGAALLAAAAFGLGIAGVFALIQNDPALAAQSTMLGSAFLTIAITLLPGAMLNLEAITGWNLPKFSITSTGIWLDILLVLIWLMLMIIGESVIYFTDLEWLLMPFIAPPAGILPIVWIARFSLRDLPARSAKSGWDIFSLALTLGPLLIAILEVIAIGAIFFIVALILVLDTSNLRAIESLAIRIQTLSEDQILEDFLPYLLQPWTIFIVLGMLSVFVPIVEELLKPIGVWTRSKRIVTPTDGFAFGVISGAGYSIFESLTAVSSSVDGWATTVFARAGTDALHMLNSGLIGWALIGALHEKKYARLAIAYVTTILIHGLWNGLSIGMGFGSLARMYNRATPVSDSAIAAGFGGLFVLGIVIFLILIHANRTLRKNKEQDNMTPLPSINGEPQTTNQ
jgi:hypothetical protein